MIGGGDTGGAMAHLLPLLAALRRRGCDARLLCLGEGGLAEAARGRGLPTEVLPMTGPWDPRVLRPLRRRLLMTPWDVVHTHGMRANLPVRLLWPGLVKDAAWTGSAAAAAGHRPAPVRGGSAAPGGAPATATPAARRPCLFTTVHSDLELDYTDPVRSRLFPGLDRLTRGRVDRIVCVSDDLRRRLEARGYRAERLLVVRSGLELQPDAAPSSDAGAPTLSGDAAARRDPAVTAAVWRGRPPEAGAPRVGTVARLVPVKDLDLFLDVVALLRSSLPGVRAAVVGDGPERERLTARARSLGLEAVVTFPGDVRPGPRVVREFDLFLLTSESEGIPMTVLEAMAAALPVVATDVGGVGEAVVDGVTGALVARGGGRAASAAGLAEHALVVLRDPALLGRLGRAGAARVREAFSVDAAAAATVAAYRACRAAVGAETKDT
ncbi:MAG: glycosyltransferase [Thermoleophilia bacterium]